MYVCVPPSQLVSKNVSPHPSLSLSDSVHVSVLFDFLLLHYNNNNNVYFYMLFLHTGVHVCMSVHV